MVSARSVDVAMLEFFRCRITYVHYVHVEVQDFSCQWVVSVYGYRLVL